MPIQIAARAYIPAPDDCPGFKGIFPVKPKGGRKRWKDKDGKIYEWDKRHGGLEVYDSRGRHIGEYDHITGNQRKPADPSRRIEP